MRQHSHIRKRNLWIRREFFRLRRRKLPVREVIGKIHKTLRSKHVFLARRTIENIIYRQ